VYVDRQTPLTSPRVSLTSEERIKLANRYRPAIRQFLSNLGVGQINTDRIDEKEEERISQEIASRIKYANSLLADGLIDREAYIDLLERARDLSGAEEALSSDD